MLDIERHILRNHKGSEENVKAKILLPLLARLGWDIIEDCYFEEEMADIFVEREGKPAFIIEAKGWEQGFDYGQGLEYSVKLKTPWVMFTSGQVTEVHHALIINANKKNPEPVLYVPYHEFHKEPDIFDQYLSLAAFKEGFPALRERCQAMLPPPYFGKSWDETEADYQKFCADIGFTRGPVAGRMTHEELEDALLELPADIQQVYRDLIDSIKVLAKGSARLRWRLNSKAFTLYALDAKREKMGRPNKPMGLLEVVPYRRGIARGFVNWKSLGLDSKLLTALRGLKAPNNAREGEEIVVLLSKCLSSVGLIK